MTNRSRLPNGDIDPLDRHIGFRILLLRNTRLLTTRQLADAIGVSRVQLDKYERGENRISAARLYRLARVGDVKLDWFVKTYQEVA